MRLSGPMMKTVRTGALLAGVRPSRRCRVVAASIVVELGDFSSGSPISGKLTFAPRNVFDVRGPLLMVADRVTLSPITLGATLANCSSRLGTAPVRGAGPA